MEKMNNREKILLVVLCNIAVVFIAYQFFIKAVMDERKELEVERQALSDEVDRVLMEETAYPGYLAQIETLKQERHDLYATCFPEAQSERIHVFVKNKTIESDIDLTSISLESKKEMTTGEDGKVMESIFTDNTARVQMTGGYANLINFMKGLEDLGRTYRLSSITISPQDSGFSYAADLHFFTVKKDTEDSIFDFYIGTPVTVDMSALGDGNLSLRFKSVSPAIVNVREDEGDTQGNP